MQQTDPWFWAREVIHAFVEANPDEWAIFQRQMEIDRHNLTDEKFGQTNLSLQNKNYQNRKRAVFPADSNNHSILEQLEKFYPDLLKNKRKFREFLREFPVFSSTQEQ